MKPKNDQLNKATRARMKVERQALFKVSGKFKTGPHSDKPNRERTRAAQKGNAIKRNVEEN